MNKFILFCTRFFVTLPLKQIDTHARNKTKPYSQTAAERAEPHLPITNTHDARGDGERDEMPHITRLEHLHSLS